MKERMLTPNELVEIMCKPDFNLSECARKTGLHLNAVRYFRDNEDHSKTQYGTIKALSEYCKGLV